MKRPTALTVLGATAALTLALGACSADGSEPASTPPPASSTPSPTATDIAEPVIERDPDVACGLVFNGGGDSLMDRIPAALTGIGAELAGEQLDELTSIHTELLHAAETAPDDLAELIMTLDEPFQAVADVVAAGGGDLSADTSHVREDITAVMSYCVDAGFTIDAE